MMDIVNDRVRDDFNVSRIEFLRELFSAGAFLFDGHYTLSSGKTSTFYANLRPSSSRKVFDGVTYYGALNESQMAKCAAMLIQLVAFEQVKPSLILPVPNGANALAIVMADLYTFLLEDKSPTVFFFGKQGKQITGDFRLDSVPEFPESDAHFPLIVENVTTTGASIEQVILQYNGGHRPSYGSCAVVTILDREQGARERIERMGMSFYALFTIGEVLEMKERLSAQSC